MTLFLTFALIFFISGFVQGVTGFGSALIAIPLLSLVLDIKFAIPLVSLNGLCINFYLALRLKQHFAKDKIFPLCLGAIPGTIFGVWFLKLADASIISKFLGVLIISYALYNLFSKPIPITLHKIWSYISGFLAGAIGTAFSAGGPPVIVYTTMNNWSKDTIKATLTGFFLFTSILTTLAHGIAGLTSKNVLYSFLYSCPFVLLGTALGSFCYGFFPRKTYLRTIYIVLIVMGAMLIAS